MREDLHARQRPSTRMLPCAVQEASGVSHHDKATMDERLCERLVGTDVQLSRTEEFDDQISPRLRCVKEPRASRLWATSRGPTRHTNELAVPSDWSSCHEAARFSKIGVSETIQVVRIKFGLLPHRKTFRDPATWRGEKMEATSPRRR